MTTADETVPEVTADEGQTLDDAGAVLLDVRELNEWQAGHVVDAVFVPLGEVAARADELPVDRRVVVICRSGVRSARATSFLRAQGFDAVNLAGGMRAWAAAGLDIVTDDGRAGTVI